MTTILKGVRVLEVAEHTFVPAASAVLADLGAEVIKIEPPGGDASRHSGPFPPGRARLLAKPLPTGSSSNVITMGIVEVASLAARVAVGPLVTMISTLSRTSSAASPGS